MKKLLAVIVAGMFAVTSAAPVFAAEKAEKTEKKAAPEKKKAAPEKKKAAPEKKKAEEKKK